MGLIIPWLAASILTLTIILGSLSTQGVQSFFLIPNLGPPPPAWVKPITFTQPSSTGGYVGALHSVTPIATPVTGVLPFVSGAFNAYSNLAGVTTAVGKSSLTYTSAAGMTLYVAMIDPIGGVRTAAITSGVTVDLAPGGTYGTGFGYGTWYFYAKLPWPNATNGAGNFNGCLGQTDTLTFALTGGQSASLSVTAIDTTIPSPTFTMHLGGGSTGLVAVTTTGPCYSGMSSYARWVAGALGQDNPGLWGYQGGYYNGTIDQYGATGGGGMLSAGNSDGNPPTKGNITGGSISIDVLEPPGGYGYHACVNGSGAQVTGALVAFSFPIALVHP